MSINDVTVLGGGGQGFCDDRRGRGVIYGRYQRGKILRGVRSRDKSDENYFNQSEINKIEV